MSVEQAIAQAEALLPGQAVESGNDPRWQAIIGLSPYIATDPDALLAFCLRWGESADADLRSAVATCLLEHLLEHHFETVFPRVELEARGNRRFADCLTQCWPFGATTEASNLQRFEQLKAVLAAS
jgi:hypothetical protein